MVIQTVLRRARLLEGDARRILSTVESAKARRFTLDASYEAVGRLSLKQDDLFRQALRCVEAELYRAAHVMAWAAFVDFLHERLAEDGLKRIRQAKPAWNVAQVEDLRNYGDYQVIEAGEDCGLYRKTMKKALQGLLNKRNECAHPSNYFPSMNETLGYVTEVLNRISTLHPKSL